MYYSPFKMLKRCYSYCRYQYKKTNDDAYLDVINRVVPIIEGNLSLFYQIISEFKTMSLVMELFGIKTFIHVNHQLDFAKHRISGVLQLDDTEIVYYSKKINEVMNEKHITKKISKIDQCVDMMKLRLNGLTIESMIEINFNPPSDLVLPSLETIEHFIPDENFLNRKHIKTYNHLIVRNPDSDPHEEYDMFIKSLKKLPSLKGVEEFMVPYHEARQMIMMQTSFNPYK